MTNYAAQAVANHIVGKTAIFSLPTVYAALFTAVGTDAGTGFTEVTGGSYARVATTGSSWNAASGTGPSTNSNASTLSFPTATGSWGTVIGWGLFDALTSGNLLVWDYLGNFTWQPMTVSSASPAVLNVPGNSYANGDTIVYTSEYGGTPPTFSASNFTGQLLVVSPSGDTFTVTNASVAVNTSSTGNGNVKKITPQTITSGVLPNFGANGLTLYWT